MDIEILSQFKDIITVVKPVNVPVQPDKTGDESLIEMLEHQIGCKLWLIHRLDRNVGGVISFSKTKESASVSIDEKYYVAVLCGTPEKSSARLENYIMKNQRLNMSKIVNKNTPGSKLAALEYTAKETITLDNQDLTLADIKLETGRHHQIRVQMANMGCPIYGDVKYNPNCRKSNAIALWSYKTVIDGTTVFRLPDGEIWGNFSLSPILSPML